MAANQKLGKARALSRLQLWSALKENTDVRRIFGHHELGEKCEDLGAAFFIIGWNDSVSTPLA